MDHDIMSRHPVIFYDGMCGMCDAFVQFVVQRDRGGLFHFAALQSNLARDTLTPRGQDPADLNTVRVLTGERVLVRGEAVLFVLQTLGGPGVALGILSALPRPLLDFGYRVAARYRYRLFGRYEACPLPDPRLRDRFLE